MLQANSPLGEGRVGPNSAEKNVKLFLREPLALLALITGDNFVETKQYPGDDSGRR
jgi:hypothetical protein